MQEIHRVLLCYATLIGTPDYAVADGEKRGRATGPVRLHGDRDARHYRTRWGWWAPDLGRARVGAETVSSIAGASVRDEGPASPGDPAGLCLGGRGSPCVRSQEQRAAGRIARTPAGPRHTGCSGSHGVSGSVGP